MKRRKKRKMKIMIKMMTKINLIPLLLNPILNLKTFSKALFKMKMNKKPIKRTGKI
jgi:hypothetical protein